jgi:4-diphosphocytidyl-2-C-methyl-D-erythritol kinase
VIWPAPAKLNLFLHILGRRPDGYHELQTAFQFIDLCDELTFEPRADGRILRRSGLASVPEQSDLVVRAARLLQKATGATSGADIRIVKRIPVEGGLGGGSSDAATTLVALNHLWGFELPATRLAEIGLELGADVPVFVHGHAAWAEGVGERLEPIDPPEHVYVVIRPDCAVSTREIFQAPELTRNTPPTTIRALFEQGGHNDCEAAVRGRYPPVAAALDWLNRYAPARLTGTGSCVFAAVEDAQRGQAIVAELPAGWQGFVAKGLNRSPLLERLAAEARD